MKFRIISTLAGLMKELPQFGVSEIAKHFGGSVALETESKQNFFPLRFRTEYRQAESEFVAELSETTTWLDSMI